VVNGRAQGISVRSAPSLAGIIGLRIWLTYENDVLAALQVNAPLPDSACLDKPSALLMVWAVQYFVR
jgi:hypothetical protein